MMTKKDKLLKEALVLPVQEKSDLIEQLIKSLVIPKGRDVAIAPPDPEIDELWKKEANKKRKAGLAKGLIEMSEDFDEPLYEE